MADATTAAAGGRRLRPRGSEVTARSAALDRLKALRRGGGASAATCQVKLEDPIYDTVAEDDYAALVARRREAVKDFIIDDDGLGYADEGEEEDWSHPTMISDYSESDNESDPERPNRKKTRKSSVPSKKPPYAPAKPTAISAAAAQRLSSMFSSSVFRRGEKAKLPSASADSIVDGILAECAPDESDREHRRRRSSGIHTSSRSVHSAQTKIYSEPVLINRQVSEGNSERAVTPRIDENIHENCDLGLAIDSLAHEIKEERNSDAKVELECNADRSIDLEKKGNLQLSEAIKSENNDNMMSSVVERKPLYKDVNSNSGGVSGPVIELGSDIEKSEFAVDSNGSLLFYIIDAYEESFGANTGTVYLFGKVKVRNAYHSCCVVVKNMQRCVYAIPDKSVFDGDKISEMKRKVKDSEATEAEFRATLQDMASQIKNEVAHKLLELNVQSFSMMPVKRCYAFERSDIPKGKQYVLKINYPFKDPPLPADLEGQSFHVLLGTHSSALELLLIKRKVKGPSWLSISNIVNCPASQRVSWCTFEVTVDCPKHVSVSPTKDALEVPPVIVAAINLKTIISEKHNVNEIVSASVVCCDKAKIDGPMMSSELDKPGALSYFTVVRRLEGLIFPTGLHKDASERNLKPHYALVFEISERALLNRLMLELHKLDCDILVGHNISGFDLDVLLHRCQVCRVPSNTWSKIGRLKRSTMPKLTKGSSLYGAGVSLGVMSCIAGRLLCDTYLCSRDLLREVSYSLTQLAKTQLNKDRKEIAPHDIPALFRASHHLLDLVEYGETDAKLSLALMFHLSILPLTRELTNISGNLWGKTLQGARAQRVEYLLLHTFHQQKYMVPDKITARSKNSSYTKRKLNAGVDGEEGDGLNENDATLVDDSHRQGKGKKGPSYAGGLVLEPKKGLYDKYILLLDFNSLYPSIIQEYNICFTTIERLSDGPTIHLPSSSSKRGVLPELLRNLVERRRSVKKAMKSAIGLKVLQLDIRQQALKLTANSMYGCLGFSNSRFYAKPLAELVTSQGRGILQSTVDLVQNTLNLEVIYGDTDSIMIYTGLDDINKAKAIAVKVIQEVNKKYRCLEIDLDGLYKRMLLLKKKKYAAVKVQTRDGKLDEVIERKGLDMVRRDWSLLAKEVGDFCLSQILSGGTCEDVLESIHSSLMKVQEEIRSDQITLEKYIITKTLTKAPEEYPDGKSQPHVQVALRLKQNGHSGCSAGDTVPYIICCQLDAVSSSTTGIAQRARHPDELKMDDGNWVVDVEYYLSQQIHPVVSRLCASIEGTSPARLAECLGLDPSKFRSKVAEAVSKDASNVLMCVINEDERYRGCEPLHLSCPSCSCSLECPPVSSLFSSSSNELASDLEAKKEVSQNFWRRMRCSRCPSDLEGCRLSPSMIANQVKRQADKFISLYYEGLMTCDDETCKYTTRALNLRVMGDLGRGTLCPNYPRCNGHLIRQYNEADLYKQLSYFCYVLDATKFVEKLDQKVKLQVEKELTVVRQVVDRAASVINGIRNRCGYAWGNLPTFAVKVSNRWEQQLQC